MPKNREYFERLLHRLRVHPSLWSDDHAQVTRVIHMCQKRLKSLPMDWNELRERSYQQDYFRWL